MPAVSATGDDDLKAVRNMTRLKELNLCYTNITDKGQEHLAGLSDLEELDLFGTAIQGDGLKHLRQLKKLKTLVCWDSVRSPTRLPSTCGTSSTWNIWRFATPTSRSRHWWNSSASCPRPPSADGTRGPKSACGEGRCGIWTVEGSVKVDRGDMQQKVEVVGRQDFVRPDGMRGSLPGGLLTLPDNSGRIQRQRYVVILEVSLKLRCQLPD